MYYTIYESESKNISYVALAKRTPFIYGRWAYEPGEVKGEIGETEEEALNNLKESLPGNDWVEWEKKE